MNVLDILNSPWAIAPEKLAEMCAIYAAHRNGEHADLKAVEAALGRPLGPGGPKPYEVQDGVAVIQLGGVLAKRMGLFAQISGGQSYQSFQQELQQAIDDPAVNAIILAIDSPGGSVDGAQAAADAVFAARNLKPIVAYVDGQMCSAAYWIGSSASAAYIGSDTDVVGSIGIVAQHIDTSAAEYMRGVKVTDITAGKYKRIASQHAPLSPEGRASIQDQIDQIYSVFVDSVARNRGTDAQAVVDKMADGRVFIGQRAIDAGLVDGKTTLPQLIARMSGGNQRTASPKQVSKGVGAPSPLRSESETTPVAAKDEVLTSARTSQPSVTAAAPTAAELKILKLRPLKHEEIAKRRLLNDAIKAGATAEIAIAQAHRSRKTAEEILPFTTALCRAQETQRSLREQLRRNEQQQLEALRG